MFTGIIEQQGKIESVEATGTNRHFTLEASFAESIKVDQSISHDGVCLTVTDIEHQEPGNKVRYRVTAVEETLKKTSLGTWDAGKQVNLERCLKAGDRLDGHFVQGHVDTIGTVAEVETRDGSWMYRFDFPPSYDALIVDRGSISVNGVSLTVAESGSGYFWVTIIPFTYEHTNFQHLQAADQVNLEFDILGKYLLKSQGKSWLPVTES
ncbi:MAG: riboflavin synthase [Bacteroidota bacterium]